MLQIITYPKNVYQWLPRGLKGIDNALINQGDRKNKIQGRLLESPKSHVGILKFYYNK